MSKSKDKNTRRKFIKTAIGGAAGIGAAGSGFGFTQTSKRDQIIKEVKTENYDVVVVGAGVAGCYAAYRLATATAADIRNPTEKNPQISPLKEIFAAASSTNLNVGLFEFSGRIGGRLLSTPIEGIPDDDAKTGPLQFAEFGGFRFDRQMRIVWKTAKNLLSLTDQPFYFNEIKVEQNNLIYVRDKQFTRSSNPGPSSRYFLTPEEKNYPFDLGNHITSLALDGALPNTPNVKVGKTITVTNPVPNSKTPNWTVTNEGDYITIVFNNTTPPFGRSTGSKKIEVNIPPTPNNFSYSYVRFHNAFNLGDWPTVKAIADEFEEAKSKAMIEGRPFYDWGWWALKRHFLSQEAVDMLEDASGYNEQAFAGSIEYVIDENYYFSVKDNVPKTINGKTIPHLSQLTSFSTTDKEGVETAWRHIRTGYSDIPLQLYNKYKQASGNSAHIGAQLIAFDKKDASQNNGYPYQLTFFRRKPGPDTVPSAYEALNNLEEGGASVADDYIIANAKLIILALPNRSLQLIDQNNFFFRNREVRNLLYKPVVNIHALRMFIAYPQAWWLKASAFSTNPAPEESTVFPVGRSATDLALRQLYYWCYNTKTNRGGTKIVDEEKPAVLLASYVSGGATEYWRGLQKGQPFDHLSGSPLSQSDERAPRRGGPRHASIAMGLEAHRQLVKMHGLENQIAQIPLPYYAHFEDWTKDPWGAGWHGWKASYPKSIYIPKIRQPIAPTAPNQGGENVYTTGECYSNVQGWVQGALNASEALLQCNLRLKWSPWLNEDGGPYDIWLGQGTNWVVPNDPNNPDNDPCIPPDYPY